MASIIALVAQLDQSSRFLPGRPWVRVLPGAPILRRKKNIKLKQSVMQAVASNYIIQSSPRCVGVCTFDENDDVCIGCGRTVEEIHEEYLKSLHYSLDN